MSQVRSEVCHQSPRRLAIADHSLFARHHIEDKGSPVNSHTSLYLLAIAVPLLMTLRAATSQESAKPSAATEAVSKKSMKIIPIVTLKPGETTRLLLTTHCTVGATRGGGFQLAEMRDGKASEGQTEGYEGASYERDGVELKIPGWAAAESFAASPKFAELNKRAFEPLKLRYRPQRLPSPV